MALGCIISTHEWIPYIVFVEDEYGISLNLIYLMQITNSQNDLTPAEVCMFILAIDDIRVVLSALLACKVEESGLLKFSNLIFKSLECARGWKHTTVKKRKHRVIIWIETAICGYMKVVEIYVSERKRWTSH